MPSKKHVLVRMKWFLAKIETIRKADAERPFTSDATSGRLLERIVWQRTIGGRKDRFTKLNRGIALSCATAWNIGSVFAKVSVIENIDRHTRIEGSHAAGAVRIVGTCDHACSRRFTTIKCR